MMTLALFLKASSFNNKFLVFQIFSLPKVNLFKKVGLKPLLDALLHMFDEISNIQNTRKTINNTYFHCVTSFLIGSFL